MGFRVRRSIKIAPGVRLNVSNKSVGISAGVRGARVTVNSRGRTTTTVAGVTHTSTAPRSNGRRVAQVQPAAAKPKPARPSLFAPQSEKQLFKQINGPASAETLHGIAAKFPESAPTAAMIELLRVAVPANDGTRSRALLNWLFDSGYDPSTDPFMAKYLDAGDVRVPIAPGVVAAMSWDRAALGLLTAELEQGAGNHARAISIVESLEPTTVAAVSLAELYAEDQRWEAIIDLTNGVTNDDIAATFLLIQRGVALREQGFFGASREALKEALRPRSRPTELRHLAFVTRGSTYLAEGKKAMARKDFERVLAEDASYPGLDEMLAATAPREV